MNRIHLSLNTQHMDDSVDFYRKLFAVEPAKLKPGYAKFDIQDPPLNLVLEQQEDSIDPGQINHLGIEVQSTDAVMAMDRRLREAGLSTYVEDNVTCCYAVQDKTWVQDPNGHAWEFFVVKRDA